MYVFLSKVSFKYNQWKTCWQIISDTKIICIEINLLVKNYDVKDYE